MVDEELADFRCVFEQAKDISEPSSSCLLARSLARSNIPYIDDADIGNDDKTDDVIISSKVIATLDCDDEDKNSEPQTEDDTPASGSLCSKRCRRAKNIKRRLKKFLKL